MALCGPMRKGGLHLTPQMIEAAYELLRATPPFRGWRLPSGDQIEFCVGMARHTAETRPLAEGYRLMVSNQCVGTLDRLLISVAHEMVHIYQHRTRRETANTEHNRHWHQVAARICRLHRWDGKEF